MASKKRWTIRKSSMGNDRVSSAYLVERSEAVGRSLSAGYRFAKTAVSNAKTFRTEAEAKKIMTSIRNRDRDADYTLIAM